MRAGDIEYHHEGDGRMSKFAWLFQWVPGRGSGSGDCILRQTRRAKPELQNLCMPIALLILPRGIRLSGLRMTPVTICTAIHSESKSENSAHETRESLYRSTSPETLFDNKICI